MTNEETLAAIHRQVGNIDGRLDEFCDRLERHDHAIFGNGGVGLKAELAIVKEHLKDLRGADASADRASHGAKVAVGGGVIALLTAALQWLGFRF